MRLFNFFIFLILFGFPPPDAFAGSRPEGEGTNQTFISGKHYRCFANIGHTLSTAKNDSRWSGIAEYCLPKLPPKNCSKDWDWSLSNKVDSASETAASKNCHITECRPNGGCNTDCHVFSYGVGRGTPVETYFYCALERDTLYGAENEWLKLAKCVDKQTGKERSDVSLCDNDTTGARYYYKPKCTETDTKEQCKNRLQNISQSLKFGLRMCYQPPEGGNVRSYSTNQGGQTVRFAEFVSTDITGTNRSGPCEQRSTSPNGGNPPDKEVEPIGSLVILDREDSKSGQTGSKIHTKISGNSYIFKIYAYDDAGKLTTSLDKLSCEITNPSGNIFSGNAQSDTAIRSFLRSGGTFRFPANDSYQTTYSGTYNIKCSGTDKNGKEVSASTEFFTAPHAYQYSQIDAIFQNSTYAQSNKGEVRENLLKAKDDKGKDIPLPLTLEYSIKDSTVKELTHSNNNWARKPVVKIGENLSVNMSIVEAKNKEGRTDTGVDNTKNNRLGLLQALNFKAVVNSIANGDSVPPAQSSSGSCQGIKPSLPATMMAIPMTNGLSANTQSIIALNEKTSMLVTGSVDIYDRALYEKIADEEKAEKKCNDQSAFPCPYPTVLRLKFEYEIVPANFIIEALNNNGNPVKVLYFGMGNTPEVEATTKLRVTALNTPDLTAVKTGDTANRDKITAKTFSSGCAAENMLINMDGMQGSGFSVTILNKDGKPYEVKSTDFKNGVADTEAIIKVEKDKDVPFRPNMKSEPVFTGDKNADGIPAKMEFAKFPPANSYYPSYNNVKLNPNLPMLILRARINSIDTDNGSGNIGSTITPTKVWYEFQCEYCNIDKVAEITGANNGKGYTNADRSPTQQGWWIDRTFSENNNNKITQRIPRIESSNSNNFIKGITNITQGLQEISYQNLGVGTHKLNILHGSYMENGQVISMPEFLLYNAYWTDSNVRWNTSSFIYVRGNVSDERRNYGIDTGGAKNTRSGGRTGKF